MKKCISMQDIRAEIDRLDRELVPLLLERLAYVSQAGSIKADRSMVRDEWRIEDVVQKAISTAESVDGNLSYIEDLYRHLIELSIKHEYGVWDTCNS